MRELIRSRLLHTLADTFVHPEISPPGDGRHVLSGVTEFRAAAVLVPIMDHADEMTVLLTRRPDHMNKHAGQVAFPGGRVDPADAHPVAAALREAHEEVGLPAHHVEIVGRLDNYHTGTGFQITPIVGIVTPGFMMKACDNEVAEIFEVPLSFLMNPENHQRKETEFKGRMAQYYAMPYKDYNIWGATAGMLVNLFNRLYA
ncbi:MAG: hypothetical protein Dbin4_00821 [Alphaproteobacteria bacterium]|nr:hypothetical protein [Alphaproteobacteria bacterium]